MKTLEAALPFKSEIAGVGLDSGERGNPPRKFVRVFQAARDAGLHAVAHAGEEGPADYIHEALDLLFVERIDHGVRCDEDPALVETLVKKQIPLTVCPLSNIKLRVFDVMGSHNLRTLLDKGLVATVNSDDPAYFGGYMNDNFIAAFEALPLDVSHARQLARNGFSAAFLGPEQKRAFLLEVDDFFAAR